MSHLRYRLPIAKHLYRLMRLTDRFGRPGGNIRGFVERTAVLPGPGRAWPTTLRTNGGGGGGGPGAEHRFFAASAPLGILDVHNAIYGALNLRFRPKPAD